MTRAELHELLDRVPDGALDRAAFELSLLAAPLDDEPFTDEDRAAVRAARAARDAGTAVVWEPDHRR